MDFDNNIRRNTARTVKICCALACLFFSVRLYAGPSREKRNEAPSTVNQPPAAGAGSTSASSAVPADVPADALAAARSEWRMIIGTGAGLFSLESSGGAGQQEGAALWSGGPVRKIVRAPDFWAILSGEGIFVSTDLRHWENRSQGLPVKTIKNFQDGKKSFLPVVQEIKDLEIHPGDSNIMVCATKDRAYLSRDQGRSWSSLGAPPYRTNGIKAVAAAYMPVAGNGAGSGAVGGANSGNVLTIFLSHSTYGLSYIQPDRAGARWIEINGGIETLETTDNADEVSDIAVIPGMAGAVPEIYVSQSFRRRIYRLDWNRKTFNLRWSDGAPFGMVDSLNAGKSALRFLYEGTVAEMDYSADNGGAIANGADGTGPTGKGAQIRARPDLLELIRNIPQNLRPDCVVMENLQNQEQVSLSELWLLDSGALRSAAQGKEGLYLPVNHAMDSSSLKPYLDVIQSRGLNMIVIDMKDDYGRLRFTPNNPAISAKGRVFRPLDIDALLQNFKSRGIYTVARIVVFKDPVLAANEGGRYAVWDSRNNKPWAGYYDVKRKQSDISDEDRKNELITILPADDPGYAVVRTFYDERWVDPYSEEVWEYTAAVAAELHSRGFDEIQFDYIRFPTDGANLGDARYRWQENGMDMESAMLSFLRHIRSRVKAPISIDIYGANGWYRTGARTGQEVELLAPWVDVICPMYYPSHFEQDFLAQNPPEQRPWRIYYQGALRTARIGRGQVIVRPYVQAFYLNVSYDRKYYNADYVRREVEGVRAAGRGGLTYWNNSGRYEDIPYPADLGGAW